MRMSKKMSVYILIGTIICIIIAFIASEYRTEELRNHGKYVTAIITDFYTIRYTHHFRYVFFIGNKEFCGSDLYYPKTDNISVGDSIVVLYNVENPSMNKPVMKK